jgi:hypothetical protein
MNTLYGALKGLGFAVLLLMVVAIAYSCFMAIYYWHGIAV